MAEQTSTAQAASMDEAPRGTKRQTKTGTVVSDKMDKTVVVKVITTVVHPLYHRYMKKTTKFYVHDEENQCGIGDEVLIVSSRPLSKNKRWRVKEILKQAQ